MFSLFVFHNAKIKQQTRENSSIEKEYDNITNKEEITRIAQITINNLCDHTRKTIMENIQEATNDASAIQFIATTDISAYLLRGGKRMINCMFTPLKRGGKSQFNCFEIDILDIITGHHKSRLLTGVV